jgi:hypothetical protein
VASWLNSLTLGTFSASVASGILTILSVANTNTPATLTFGSPNVTQAFQATSVTLVQVLQAIINYLCNLTDLQIALANNLTVCTLDYNNNVVSTTYASGTKQSAYNSAIANAICNICARINTLVAFTCTKLQALFSDNPNAQFSYANDRFLSIVGGACTTLTSSQAALAFINAINANQNVKNAFCAIVCTTTGTCPGISNVNFSSTSTSTIGFYGVTFSPVPSANQLVTLMYRVHGTTTWITASSNINLFPNGNINGTTPYLITGLTPGVTYDVSVGPNCGGTPFVSQVTVQPGGVLSGNYLLDNVIYAICGDSPVILYSNVPFATGTTMYTNSSLTTPVTGYTLISNTLTGAIYNINSSTGVVGTATGSNCTSGTAGTYILGNNSGTICSGGTQTLYTNGAFGVGQVLYYDSALSTPVTGFAYVVQSVSSEIFNLNSSTGVIGSYTGSSCTGNTVLITSDMFGSQVSAVSGIVGFVNTGGSFPINPGGEVTGTHGAFTGNISITITGTPSVSPSSVGLTKNSVLIQCINITAAGTYTFPSESYLATDQIAVFANGSSC